MFGAEHNAFHEEVNSVTSRRRMQVDTTAASIESMQCTLGRGPIEPFRDQIDGERPHKTLHPEPFELNA